jgi:sporulation protein YunB
MNRLLPVVETMAVNRARNICTDTINQAAGKVIKDNNITYDMLMELEKDSSGNITAVKANTLKIDELKYKISNEVIKELNEADTSSLSIPLGTVIGGQLFHGLGPKIRVNIERIGSAETKIINEFSSAGINQTRQQVLLEVDASITVLVSTSHITTNVKSNYTIADTVIVGNVPDSYTVVDDSSGKSNSDKIFIYGNKGSK